MRDEALREGFLGLAPVREVLEETGVQAEVLSLISVRTRYEPEGGAVFVIFRMRPLGGELRPDGTEIDAVRYLSLIHISEPTRPD